MSRRADPERIHQARRDAVRNTLAGTGTAVETADRWCDAWEAEAERRSLGRDRDYWDAGWDWIAAERTARRSPCRQASAVPITRNRGLWSPVARADGIWHVCDDVRYRLLARGARQI